MHYVIIHRKGGPDPQAAPPPLNPPLLSTVSLLEILIGSVRTAAAVAANNIALDSFLSVGLHSTSRQGLIKTIISMLLNAFNYHNLVPVFRHFPFGNS